MSPRSFMRLLLLAPLVLVGCGVPISAADLALTPEPQPTVADVTIVGQAALAGGGDGAVLSTARLASPGPLTTQQPLTPLATATARPTGTATPTAAATSTQAPSPTGTPPTATPTPDTSNLVAEVIRLLNKYRTDSGRPALRVNSALMSAAGAYAKQMADANWFTCGCDFHTGPDGSQPEGRIARAGYTGRFKGEAIAGGQGDAQGALNAWLTSPAHAAIALDSSAVDVGIGYYYNPNAAYGHFWVLVTGSP